MYACFIELLEISMVQSAISDGEAVSIEPELGGHELVLFRLAETYSGPDQQRAEKAFRWVTNQGRNCICHSDIRGENA